MAIPVRAILRTFALAAAASLFSVSFADEEATGRINTAGLVKFEANGLSIEYEDWVSTEVLSHGTVRKIGYGNVSHVNISTTATGTYSTDGLASPHVLYPGIHVERSAETDRKRPPALAGIGRGGSVLFVGSGRDLVVVTPRTTCFVSRSFAYC